MPSSPRLPWPQLLVPQVPFCYFQGLGLPGRLHTVWPGCSEVLLAASVGHPLRGSRILVLGQTLVTSSFGLSLHYVIAVFHHDDSPRQIVLTSRPIDYYSFNKFSLQIILLLHWFQHAPRGVRHCVPCTCTWGCGVVSISDWEGRSVSVKDCTST